MSKYLLPFLFPFLLLSCNKKVPTPVVDTKIDFSKVDTPPVFKNCKSLIDEEKDRCFEETIQKTLNEELSKILLKKSNILNTNFTISLTFHKTGKTLLNSLEIKNILAVENLEFEKALEKAVQKLRVVYPATKQGIPVTTVYSLPIQLNLES